LLPGGEEDALIVKSPSGDMIDTVYSIDGEIPELTETEEDYAEAEEYFLTANYSSAEQVYNAIINSIASAQNKYKAHIRKYEIGKLTGASLEFFEEMGSTYTTLSNNTEDTLTSKIFRQLSTLCLVGQEEYIPAIGEFDEVIQQNPNTEEAVYAEIDAMTTALLVEGNDTTLHKTTLGKYLVKGSGDYFSKLNEIMKKHFGSGKTKTEENIIPKEYTLYQNYPNPFNPSTTIKYDLPETGNVELTIYDILGRRVKTLINAKQQAGKYEVKFDATNLASGVYLYQVRSENFVNTKKMILLK